MAKTCLRDKAQGRMEVTNKAKKVTSSIKDTSMAGMVDNIRMDKLKSNNPSLNSLRISELNSKVAGRLRSKKSKIMLLNVLWTSMEADLSNKSMM
jgi:hypothetical protein